MRDHIVSTVTGLGHDLERLNQALTGQRVSAEVVAIGLDIVDRLEEERAWLRAQPLSSMLDADVRSVMNRYRLVLARAHLLGEKYVLTLDPADVAPWLAALVEVSGVMGEIAAVPE